MKGGTVEAVYKRVVISLEQVERFCRLMHLMVSTYMI